MATWLTVKQAAEYLQLSTATVYLMARENALPASRVGGQWRFEESEIDNWLRCESIRNRQSRGVIHNNDK